MIHTFRVTDLNDERPPNVMCFNLILLTLSVKEQSKVRKDAQEAVRLGATEVAVVNGRTYQLPAKGVLQTLNNYRKKEGWKSEGTLQHMAEKLERRSRQMEEDDERRADHLKGEP